MNDPIASRSAVALYTIKRNFSMKKQFTTSKYKVTKVSDFSEIWECPLSGAKSIHATTNFLPDHTISSFGAKEILPEPNYLTVQLNEHEHIMLSPVFLQYINHSCTPNVFFDTTNLLVSCLRKIEVGEEMTFFYPSTEYSMAQGFDCLCETKGCLKRIQGAANLHPDILLTYRLSDYIKHKLKTRIG